MSEKQISDTENQKNTERFFHTNGPPPGEFEPDIPHHLLANMSPNERYLCEMACISAKQNGWLIKETIGLKGAHRLIQNRLEEGEKRFSIIECLLKSIIDLRDKWLSRKNLSVTFVILPAIGIVLAELIKPLLLKLLSIHP
jgi:hypothetical protein